jgi:hypothetical protein
MSIVAIAAVLAVALVAAVLWSRLARLKRAEFIRRYPFPAGLFDRFDKVRPGLDLKSKQLIARGLRKFFLAHLASGRQFVSMPSQAVDDLWHEFILYTRNYEQFCKQAFGRFLHHTPAVALGAQQQNNAGLRRTWWYCCKEENIDPRAPTRLPLLFALDAKLGVAGGFVYAANCEKLRRNGNGAVYCGGDFSSSGFDGGTDGFGDGGSSDGGGDSGGGGGCGGGGD